MSWGRLDDRANGNAKLLALSDAAWRMWGCALIYCQFNLTDGFVPTHVIETFGVRAKNKAAIAHELCSVLVPGKGPCWHPAEGGFRVHDYFEWNASKEQVEIDRLTAKQRMALFQNPELRQQIRQRDGDECRYCDRTVRWADRKGPSGGTYDHVRPYGGNSLDNLVVACRGCNSRKRGRSPEDAQMPLREPKLKPNKSDSQSRFDLDVQQEAQQASTTTTTTTERSKERERSGRARARVFAGERLKVSSSQHQVLLDEMGSRVDSWDWPSIYAQWDADLVATGEEFDTLLFIKRQAAREAEARSRVAVEKSPELEAQRETQRAERAKREANADHRARAVYAALTDAQRDWLVAEALGDLRRRFPAAIVVPDGVAAVVADIRAGLSGRSLDEEVAAVRARVCPREQVKVTA